MLMDIFKKTAGRIGGFCLALGAMTANSEDIDLFVGPGSLIDNGASNPNVLFLVDNTANWNQAFTNEMQALHEVFCNLAVNEDGSAKFNVGIMMFTETGAPNSNVDGGYVRAGIRGMDDTTKQLYANLIGSFDSGGTAENTAAGICGEPPTSPSSRIAEKGNSGNGNSGTGGNQQPNGDKSNGGKIGLTMAEAYAYFSSGSAPSGLSLAGSEKVKTDYQGNNNADATAEDLAIYSLSADGRYALNAFDGTTYNGPDLSGCKKNFIIYLSNGAAQDNTSDTNKATSWLSSVGGSTEQIVLSPSGSQDNVGDEWARYMKSSPEGITVYTLDIDKVLNGQGPGWTALLKSMASVSGGKYFDVDSSDTANITAAIETALSEILAVNSVFASVSLPASANTQSTFLNQVFIGMFRPDASALPRWHGNLKQYRLGVVDGDIRLLDAKSAPDTAINSSTGFITECARSYWTPDSTDTYWSFRENDFDDQYCAAVTGSKASNSPDGPVVEKGAQGHQLRSLTPTQRASRVKTCGSCSDTSSLLSFTSTGETPDRADWANGQDLQDEDGDGTASTETRSTVHGDIIHSRPVAVNYGGDDFLGNDGDTSNDSQVVVYYSGNDGMLRAVNGNRSASLDGYAAGEEIWSFVAPEFKDDFERLYSNDVRISFPGVAGQPKPYALDGSLTAFQGQINTTDKTYLYATMRRGGRHIYAFDVTDPSSPSLLWRRGCPPDSDIGCTSSDWEQIGQTWSQASIAKASGHANPIILVGGGYDSCEDYDYMPDNDDVSFAQNHNCITSGTKGNRVYVVDGHTGGLLNALGGSASSPQQIRRGIVGQVTVVPDSNGNIQYAYAADAGGNLYRISGADANSPIGSTAPANWTITRIAELGCDTGGQCALNRKFLFGPDVAANNGGYAILIGSGDREKPVDFYEGAKSVSNHFYVIQDQPTQTDWLDEACGANKDYICVDQLYEIPDDPADVNATAMAARKGWYLDLRDGENVVTSAIVVTNRINFSTFIATDSSLYGTLDDNNTPDDPNDDFYICEGLLGEASVYNLNFDDAAPLDGDSRFQRIVGDGLPPSPVAGQVILDDGTKVPFCIGCSADSPLEAKNPSAETDYEIPKANVYWRVKQ